MSALAIVVILSVFGFIISQRLTAARGPRALPWNRPPVPWRYSEMEKQTAGGPLPGWLVYGLCVVALVNFAIYVIAARYLGGDAVNGFRMVGAITFR